MFIETLNSVINQNGHFSFQTAHIFLAFNLGDHSTSLPKPPQTLTCSQYSQYTVFSDGKIAQTERSTHSARGFAFQAAPLLRFANCSSDSSSVFMQVQIRPPLLNTEQSRAPLPAILSQVEPTAKDDALTILSARRG